MSSPGARIPGAGRSAPGHPRPARVPLVATARWAVPAGLAGGYAAAQWLGRTYGSTRAERAASLPGDDIVSGPRFVITHATTIGAPPERVWPWLVQMGWHRGGWYTARWVDRLLFPANRPSAGQILYEYQDLHTGDFIPDGPPETECGFIVERLEPGRHLVLHSTSHLPLSWRREGKAAIDWSWAFILSPAGGGQRTRFIFRWRARVAPRWAEIGCAALIVPADLVMSRDMLRGIKARAERDGLRDAQRGAGTSGIGNR